MVRTPAAILIASFAVSGCSSTDPSLPIEASAPSVTKDERTASETPAKPLPDELPDPTAPDWTAPEGDTAPEYDWNATGRVGDELDVPGDLWIRVGLKPSEDHLAVTIAFSGWTTVAFEQHVIHFSQHLTAAQTRALIAEETVILDGTMGLAWGHYSRTVMRAMRESSLVRDDEGEVTLRIGLDDMLFRMDETDTRYGDATEAVFQGQLHVSCSIADPDGTAHWGSFSQGVCKQAADALGLWPLLPEQAP